MSKASSTFTEAESGFTLIELLVVVALISILSLTSIGLIDVYKKRAFDSVSISDYRHIKTAIIEAESKSEAAPTYSFSDLKGPVKLPAPLEVAALSRNVNLFIAERTTSSSNQPIHRLELAHTNGNFRYRYISVDGIVLEQIIQQ